MSLGQADAERQRAGQPVDNSAVIIKFLEGEKQKYRDLILGIKGFLEANSSASIKETERDNGAVIANLNRLMEEVNHKHADEVSALNTSAEKQREQLVENMQREQKRLVEEERARFDNMKRELEEKLSSQNGGFEKERRRLAQEMQRERDEIKSSWHKLEANKAKFI